MDDGSGGTVNERIARSPGNRRRGYPIVVVYRETEAEREARRGERKEQAERSREVARSLTQSVHGSAHISRSVSVGEQHKDAAADHLEFDTAGAGEQESRAQGDPRRTQGSPHNS